MTHPTDHELNKLLAEVVGVGINEGEAAGQKFWWHINPGLERQTWSPVTCPIQMERVEEALIKVGMLCKIGWYGTQYEAWVGTKIDAMGAVNGEFGFDKKKNAPSP